MDGGSNMSEHHKLLDNGKETWNFKSTIDLSPVSEPLTKAEKELAKAKLKIEEFLNADTL